MVLGTSEGWTKTLSLIGVGYRAAVTGQQLTLSLGYSHPIVLDIPKDLTVQVRLIVVRDLDRCVQKMQGN